MAAIQGLPAFKDRLTPGFGGALTLIVTGKSRRR